MTILILCEGKHDVCLLERIIREHKKIIKRYEKDSIIRRVVEGKSLPKFVIVEEGGKTQLLKEIQILVSKLRSISRNVKILAILDQDDDPKKIDKSLMDLGDYLKRTMKSLIESKFPIYKPSFEININTQCYSVKLVVYFKSANVTIMLFMIPKSLEYQVAKLRGKDEKSITCEDIENAPFEDIDWFVRLNELISALSRG